MESKGGSECPSVKFAYFSSYDMAMVANSLPLEYDIGGMRGTVLQNAVRFFSRVRQREGLVCTCLWRSLRPRHSMNKRQRV